MPPTLGYSLASGVVGSAPAVVSGPVWVGLVVDEPIYEALGEVGQSEVETDQDRHQGTDEVHPEAEQSGQQPRPDEQASDENPSGETGKR